VKEVPYELDAEVLEDTPANNEEALDDLRGTSTHQQERIDLLRAMEESRKEQEALLDKLAALKALTGRNPEEKPKTQPQPEEKPSTQRQTEQKMDITLFPSVAMLQPAKTFSGKREEDVQDFVEQTEVFLSAVGGTEVQRRGFVMTKLDGSAKATARRFIQEQPAATAGELLAKLQTIYGCETNREARKKMMRARVRRKSETLTEYVEEKWRLCTDCGIIDNEKRNNYILMGLGKDLYMRYGDATELSTDQLIQKLRREESRLARFGGHESDKMQYQIDQHFGPEKVTVKKIETPQETSKEPRRNKKNDS
jgi:hypothetical protein